SISLFKKEYVMNSATQRQRLRARLNIYQTGNYDGQANVLSLKRGKPTAYILVALKKIEDGDYEICSNCKNPIPEDRLELVPGALRCAPCQTQQEKVNGKK
ncbi:MAG: TraR/DksA family transcriptional regulator, partial [Candidatus Falkowbacteria bacterium]|nr:TraR/DksA family transcriptional regulator [Candidatus Falkowbacteria bacterium]